MPFHAALQLMLQISLEGKDGWVEENRNGEKSDYRKSKGGNYIKVTVSTELVENCITTL